MLTLLLRKQNQLAPYGEFTRVHKGKAIVCNKATLFVVVTHIRRKLRAEWAIQNVRGQGFVLQGVVRAPVASARVWQLKASKPRMAPDRFTGKPGPGSRLSSRPSATVALAPLAVQRNPLGDLHRDKTGHG